MKVEVTGKEGAYKVKLSKADGGAEFTSTPSETKDGFKKRVAEIIETDYMDEVEWVTKKRKAAPRKKTAAAKRKPTKDKASLRDKVARAAAKPKKPKKPADAPKVRTVKRTIEQAYAIQEDLQKNKGSWIRFKKASGVEVVAGISSVTVDKRVASVSYRCYDETKTMHITKVGNPTIEFLPEKTEEMLGKMEKKSAKKLARRSTGVVRTGVSDRIKRMREAEIARSAKEKARIAEMVEKEKVRKLKAKESIQEAIDKEREQAAIAKARAKATEARKRKLAAEKAAKQAALAVDRAARAEREAQKAAEDAGKKFKLKRKKK